MTLANEYGEVLQHVKLSTTQDRPRCANTQCNKLLAELVTAPWRIRCRHCKLLNGESGIVQSN